MISLGDKKLYSLNLVFILWLILAINNNLDTFDNVSTDLIFYTLNFIGINFYGWFLLGIIAYKYEVNKT